MNNSLSALASHLNDAGIQYFLLTDFNGDFVSKDVDLFVASDCRELFEKTLFKSGWHKRKEPAFHTNHHFYYSPDSKIYLDVKYELSFAKGDKECYTYNYTSEAIARATLNHRGFYRPDGIDAVVLYAAHLAYNERGKLENKHKELLASYLSAYNSRNHKTPAAFQEISNWIEEDFPNTGKLQIILDSYFRRDYKLMVRNKRFDKYGWGIKVLFLGTDGAGKTTLIEEVKRELNFKTKSLYLGMGESGWTSSIVKRLFKLKVRIQLLGKLYNFLKGYILLPFEFALRVLSVKVKSRYSVVLIDRFPGTVFLDKSWIRRVIFKSILPRPDLVFFIYADPQILVNRRPSESTLERSKADIIKFQKVADIISRGQYISIDTSNVPIAETRDLIISEIYKSPGFCNNLFTPNHY